MRKLLVIAPLALLAACNNADTATDTAGAAGASGSATATAEPAMTVVADAENTIDWTGTYTGTDASGATVSLTLNTGDTFSMTSTTGGGVAGAPVNGSFSWYRDGNRILLDAAGGGAIYAVGNGALFRMANAEAPTTGPMDRTTALIRAAAPAAPAEPTK